MKETHQNSAAQTTQKQCSLIAPKKYSLNRQTDSRLVIRGHSQSRKFHGSKKEGSATDLAYWAQIKCYPQIPPSHLEIINSFRAGPRDGQRMFCFLTLIPLGSRHHVFLQHLQPAPLCQVPGGDPQSQDVLPP